MRRLSVLMAVAFVDMMGLMIIWPLLPLYAVNMHATPTVVGFLGDEAVQALDDLKVRWLPVEDNDGESGVVAAHFTTPRGVCVLD